MKERKRNDTKAHRNQIADNLLYGKTKQPNSKNFKDCLENKA